jgi:tetratricopeptide (TPR) repeat protein
LASLAGVADDIVVVDTGSTDASVAIAEARGARVFHHAWEADFAKARNVALGHARGRWILYIDADERLCRVDRARLHRLLVEAEEVAFLIPFHPFVRSTPYLEYRLWRNDPRIRFQGVIHETMRPAIEEVGRADGRPISTCELIAIQHVGYEGDQTAKHRRNLSLLQAQLEVEPDNIFNWRHLGLVWAGLGHPEKAELALDRAVALARLQPSRADQGGVAWAELVRHRHAQGKDVADLLAEGLQRWPGNWLLVWVSGQVHAAEGRDEAAVECFQRLLGVDTSALPATDVAYDERIFGVYAQASLALSLFRLGRYAEAADAYAAAERLEPDNPEHGIKRLLAESRLRSSARGATG